EQILETSCAVLTETCHRFLDLTGPLQIGVLPRISSSFQAANMDYNGCICDLYIDHKFVDLNHRVVPRRKFCDSTPCRNGGSCRDGWFTHKCDCPQGFGGKDCSDNIFSSPSYKPTVAVFRRWNLVIQSTLAPDTATLAECILKTAVRWHHLEITWLGTEVRLNVDYGQTVALVLFAPKIQGFVSTERYSSVARTEPIAA
ncbi:starry night, partial [Carabus blaptoides fortunei]